MPEKFGGFGSYDPRQLAMGSPSAIMAAAQQQPSPTSPAAAMAAGLPPPPPPPPPLEGSVQRPKHGEVPRVSRACERCHSLKAKCVSGDKPGVCLKCQRAGSRCLPHRRRRRDAASKAAALASAAAAKAAAQGDGALNTSAYPTPMPEAGVAFNAPTSTAEVVMHARPGVANIDDHDPIDRELLSVADARKCLSSFAALHEHFPCVDMTNFEFEHVRRNRPFLFKSILASTTSLKPEVCAKLDLEVRETIGQRVIVQAEKSVDLLEGMLVYIAWYHFHIRPSNQRPYQLVQLAIGMTIDLGFPSAKRIKFDRVTFTLSSSVPVDSLRSRQVVSIDRAVVACWYLSSTFSMATCKPNNFSFRGFVNQCFDKMSETSHTVIDRRFLQLILLQRAIENSSTSLVQDLPTEQSSSAQHQHVQNHMENLQQALQVWQNDTPKEAKGAAFTTTACEYSKVLLYESALQCLQDYVTDDSARTNDSKSKDDSIALQRELLYKQLEAVKVYLEALLRYSIADLLNLTMVEWIRLTFIVVALSKLSLTERGVPGWDSAAARENVKLDHYLEILSYRAQKLSQGQLTTNSGRAQQENGETKQAVQGPPVENFAWSFHHIMETMQQWYTTQLKLLAARSAAPPDGTNLDPCPLEFIEVDTRRKVLEQREAAAASAAGGDTMPHSRADSTDEFGDLQMDTGLDLGMDFGSADWTGIFNDWTPWAWTLMAPTGLE